jgi:hypothetical protein
MFSLNKQALVSLGTPAMNHIAVERRKLRKALPERVAQKAHRGCISSA